ncbi:bifunctional UDP-N-acetylmuramoyl-tripeptide:D-alanyl-D-alanine ligase/alanine racemase [Paenimyroides baculatum]|uniref:Alanine racemase n=1 Tax=Paenimyroides baculatum TaxID=2608000 RepID=A0A5M6CSY9_9FLAO|nr:bifunctional UDP-N-acetylmuramoyl-tripeptide:D-alanyl-D-alanine ligase/alanine racemase [Paenimyroides baculatum]KAA5538056.1 bifunctional UDP-N-acetylmuramoyl-tripeptide:D-alanyl-D-alanine ligase/alanine racemase [Paenimyroides baculatum]
MKIETSVLRDVLHTIAPVTKNELNVLDISVDSRSLRNTANTLFFALKGNNHNAHDFLNDLYAKGVRYFVVSQDVSLPHNAVVFKVDDTLRALQRFVAFYRKKYTFPVIGITGSNGKTIVKEWLNQLLLPFYNIIKSPKSYNSQVGVPLSVIAINEEHNLGIFEAGISQPNEMDFLEEVIQPTIGILTNIGPAHNEGFSTKEEKLQEKIKLFKNADVLISEKTDLIVASKSEKAQWFTWSFNETADVQFKKIDTVLNVKFNNAEFSVDLPFTDLASVENIATCITALLFLKIDTNYIVEAIPQLQTVQMRLQVKKGMNDCLLIDDSYSSDYQSLKIALDFLEQQKTHQQKTVILSDIFQSGFTPEVLYQKVAQLLNQNHVTRVIGIGNKIGSYLTNVPQFQSYPDTETFLNDFNLRSFRSETILIKGSRSFQFEKIVAELEEKTHETVLEINLDAISHNLNFYKSKLKPTTKVMVMVKAFGYGNGSYEIAKLLAHHQVSYLGVAFADEGVELRKAGIKIPIVVMNPENSAFSTMIAYNLEPEIYNIEELNTFLQIAENQNLYNYPIHLKLNTGMNRLGFVEKDFDSLINLLKQTNLVEVASMFSHLATSDMPEERDFTLQQIQLFQKWSTDIKDQLNINPTLHILNTSGIYNFGEYQMDMVRVGIGLYGVGNDTNEDAQLQNVATLKTVVLQINDIEKDATVGYGRRFKAERKSKIATIAIGYADGIRRSYGNGKGCVLVNNQKAFIAGTVCMDMLMIDVTDMDVKIGDEVIVFGNDLRITEIAKIWETIPYEVMTSISQRVKRIFYKE